MMGGYVYNKFGLKFTYTFSFLIGIVGGIGILYLEEIHKIEKDMNLSADYRLEREQLFQKRMP